MTPKVCLGQNQLRDLFGTPVILAAAERAQDGHWLVGNELVFDHRFTFDDGKCDELAAATIKSNIYIADLPPHSRHRPIERSNFDPVMRHVALSYTRPESYSTSGLQRQAALDAAAEPLSYSFCFFETWLGQPVAGTRLLVSHAALLEQPRVSQFC